MRRVLVVAAHPDDEILGCSGSIVRLVQEGYKVYTLILGEGVTSRDEKRQREKREKEIERLRDHAYRAGAIIGVEKLFFHDLPDNRFDKVELLDIVKLIEKVKNDIKPEIVYTHYRGDLNIDHRVTYNAVLTACRPIKDETVKEIYSFEVPSSTEWNYPSLFNPNIFMNIAGSIDKKIEALKSYENELKDFPHPRSEETIRAIAKRWGSVVGLKCAEAFEVVRIVS